MTSTQTLTTTDAADLTIYYEIHQAMRVANEKIIAGLTDPTLVDDDRRRAAAMGRWFAGYRDELRTHHHVEDHLIFPALSARVPAYGDYADMLAADHDRLDVVIDGLAAALGRMATHGGDWSSAKAEATAYAVELRDLLIEHLAIEDSDVIPMIERHFSQQEYAVIEKQVMKQVTPRQALFTVPWWMATASPEAAAKSWTNAPLPLKVIYYTTRRRYARLVAAAFGS
jgi:hemerythrin-like domain-containing protein